MKNDHPVYKGGLDIDAKIDDVELRLKTLVESVQEIRRDLESERGQRLKEELTKGE